MELRNKTDLQAGWLNTSLDDLYQLGAAIGRACYRLNGSDLVPAADVEWPVDGAGGPSSFGEMPPDSPFMPGGFDVMVVGECVQPGGEAGESAAVELRIGRGFHRRIDVFGDRVWVEVGTGLVPSRPAPFVSMPLTWDRAFGGTAKVETGEFPWPENPEGRGFFGTAEAALGGALPNLEDPSDRVRGWDQRVTPWCWGPYPSDGSLRSTSSVDVDPEDPIGITRLKPTLFNQAHPNMVIPASDTPSPGDLVEVHNMSSSGVVRFALPAAAYHLHTQLEDRNYLFPMVMDQLLMNPTEGLVAFSYRAVVKYRMRPLERRVCTLYDGPVPRVVPPDYPQHWDRGGRRVVA